MIPIASNLEAAARSARERTTGDAAATARNPLAIDGSLGVAAEHELFTEALLGAAKAHFEEIKTVTR